MCAPGLPDAHTATHALTSTSEPLESPPPRPPPRRLSGPGSVRVCTCACAREFVALHGAVAAHHAAMHVHACSMRTCECMLACMCACECVCYPPAPAAMRVHMQVPRPCPARSALALTHAGPHPAAQHRPNPARRPRSRPPNTVAHAHSTPRYTGRSPPQTAPSGPNPPQPPASSASSAASLTTLSSSESEPRYTLLADWDIVPAISRAACAGGQTKRGAVWEQG